jgi:hypothetical protein
MHPPAVGEVKINENREIIAEFTASAHIKTQSPRGIEEEERFAP